MSRESRRKQKKARMAAKDAARKAERRARDAARQAQALAAQQQAALAEQMKIYKESMERQASENRAANLKILQQAQDERSRWMDDSRRAAAASQAREDARLRAVQLQSSRDRNNARVSAANQLVQGTQANVDMGEAFPGSDLGGTTQFRRRKQQFKTKGAGYTGLSIKSGSSDSGSAQNKMVNV